MRKLKVTLSRVRSVPSARYQTNVRYIANFSNTKEKRFYTAYIKKKKKSKKRCTRVSMGQRKQSAAPFPQIDHFRSDGSEIFPLRFVRCGRQILMRLIAPKCPDFDIEIKIFLRKRLFYGNPCLFWGYKSFRVRIFFNVSLNAVLFLYATHELYSFILYSFSMYIVSHFLINIVIFLYIGFIDYPNMCHIRFSPPICRTSRCYYSIYICIHYFIPIR